MAAGVAQGAALTVMLLLLSVQLGSAQLASEAEVAGEVHGSSR